MLYAVPVAFSTGQESFHGGGKVGMFCEHFILTENPTERTMSGNSQLVQDLPHSAMPNAVCHAIVI